MKRGLALALLVGVLALGAPADAHVERIPTTVVITYASTSAIGGYIQSKVTPCRSGRTVTVSAGAGDPGTQVTSDANGNWIAPGPFGFGANYTASVDKLFLKKTRAHKHFCKADADTKQTS